jgi:hypothetical protein
MPCSTRREFWFRRVDDAPDAPRGDPGEIAVTVERVGSRLRF